MRLDQYIAQQFGISRAYAQKMLKQEMALVNGKPGKASYQLQKDDIVTGEIPKLEKLETLPEDIALEIVYEDKDLLVINKPAGMVVHPACGHLSGTLVNALLGHCKDLSGIGGSQRPGIVHRLDRDTSGLIIIAKNDLAHHELSKQFQTRTIKKKYRALVQGNVLSSSGTIDQPLGRNPQRRMKVIVTTNEHFHPRSAVTHYRVIKRMQSSTLLDVDLETGRTHQIRVHLAFIDHSIVGDPIYGKPGKAGGLKLQAYYLEFTHPRTEKKMKFEIEPLEWGR
jgi:23S rRNA pseudouridine1911/1915/1917 synthase